MRNNNQILGTPESIYKDTKTSIEALSSPTSGMMAYATDTKELGIYTLGVWTWTTTTAWTEIPTKIWLYQSTTVFKEYGDVTSTYITGRRLRWKYSTTYLYGTVVSSVYSSESGITLVTIKGDALQNLSESYQAYSDGYLPEGFPVEYAITVPAPHSGTHQDGGTDELSVTGLSGLLADAQKPLDWITYTETWTYSNSYTITISGVDLTSRYPKGTKVKLTNDSTTKYFYVSGCSYSTNTTVYLASNAGNGLVSGSITNVQISYTNPPDFPNWFTYTPTWTGFTTPPTASIRFTINNRTCMVDVSVPSSYTSNATTITITLPVNSSSSASRGWDGFGIGLDNSSWVTTPTYYTIAVNASTANLYKGIPNVAWTASGNKTWQGMLVYEI